MKMILVEVLLRSNSELRTLDDSDIDELVAQRDSLRAFIAGYTFANIAQSNPRIRVLEHIDPYELYGIRILIPLLKTVETEEQKLLNQILSDDEKLSVVTIRTEYYPNCTF